MYSIKSEKQYVKKRQIADAYQTEAKKIMFRNGKQTNYLTAEERKGLPKVTNADRSAIEVYEFKKDKPEKYTAYVNPEKRKVTTWTGQELGSIYEMGVPYRDNFGGERQNIKFKTDSGDRYSGTYFKSSGNYARFKKLK